ncbi:MAG: hypothetical protein ACMXYK_05385 [Candidatus Woesearchaeota archaeon]
MLRKQKTPKEKVSSLYFTISNVFRVLLIIALVIEVFNGRWMLFFVTLLALFLSCFPYFFEKRYRMHIPPEIHAFIVIFIYASIYLGEVHDFYYRFWWWDSVLHAVSGFVLGIIGFGILYALFKGKKLSAKPGTIVFLSFCFALAMGTIWEIFEFAMDTFFGLNMQKVHIGTGVTDTMIDLILDALGALVASILGYFYLKKGDSKIYNRLVTYFEKKNPELFKK